MTFTATVSPVLATGDADRHGHLHRQRGRPPRCRSTRPAWRPSRPRAARPAPHGHRRLRRRRRLPRRAPARSTQTVNKTATTTVVVSDLNPSTVGDRGDLHRDGQPAARPPDGPVHRRRHRCGCHRSRWSRDRPPSRRAALAVGGHLVGATYGGDAAYLASTSPTLTQTVGPALRATTTVVTSNRNPAANLRPERDLHGHGPAGHRHRHPDRHRPVQHRRRQRRVAS